MSLNPVVASHLTEARRELIEQRDRLDHDIAQLDSMLQGYAGPGVGPSTQTGRPESVSRGPAPAMKDAIIEHLMTEDREFSTNEVATALNKRYGWELSSTRSQISKMGKAREVIPVRRGVYRAITEAALAEYLGVDVSRNSSGPDESGPEGDVTASGMGGDANAEDDQDHGLDSQGHNRDPRPGASVEVSSY